MKAGWTSVAVSALAIIGAALSQKAVAQNTDAQTAQALAKRSGCFKCHSVDKNMVGPAFHDIAARYNNEATGYDIAFMSVPAIRDLPEERKSLVIVALVGGNLHIRIFDSNGRRVIDKAEAKLIDGKLVSELRKQLKDRIADEFNFTAKERQQILESVLSIAGLTRAHVREALIETIKHGGKGNWTDISHGVPMPPFSNLLSDAEIKRLVDWVLRPAGAIDLKVIKMGLGSGTVTSSPPGINCGGDCGETYGTATSVTLTATPDAGSAFSHWEGDASGTSNPVTVGISANSSVRAVFDLTPAIQQLSIAELTPTGIQTYLNANPRVNTPARFLFALPPEFKQNWILMSRSESLQTGIAEFPRLLLPAADSQTVFTMALSTHVSYPGAHSNAIEFMQWDPTDKNFRFHEIVLDPISAMGVFPARPRGISIDDQKCSKCHSTRNVLNRSTFPGTTGVTPGVVKAKNKPNWDTYDSWGGMMPFNRDRIYQGSVEAAAFRAILNPWTWSTNDGVRSVIEQLDLQPPGVPPAHVITRTNGGTYDGHINFQFDTSPPVLIEPAPTGANPPITTNYAFDGAAGTGPATSVVRGGSYVTLHHSNIPTSDEGRGVRLFDNLGGGVFSTRFNQKRIADELIDHRFATGSVPIEIRPIALAISKGLMHVTGNTVTSTPAHGLSLGFFDFRNGMTIDALLNDTRTRTQSAPRRKADIQKINLDRTVDAYLSTALGGSANGLIQQFGPATSAGTDILLPRIRQEVFRRPIDAGSADSTAMGGIYVDRELYNANTELVALYRYFLEPLGVSVDKWSMSVRGRSRTYAFADVFGNYTNELTGALTTSLLSNPVPGLSNPNDDAQLIAAVNSTLSTSSLPAIAGIPTFTDVQRIFNKSCIECHGGLNYPPYSNYGTFLDLSEDESPPVPPPPGPSPRLYRSHSKASALANFINQKINRPSEACPDITNGMMPCGGPALSKTDINTIKRWTDGATPFTVGDPHIKTIDGVNYDFQAAGEFVALRGEDVEIQVRQTPVATATSLGPNAHTGLSSYVSVNSAIAVRVGPHRITYEPNVNGRPDPEGLQLRVDGELKKLTAQAILLKSGGRIMQTIAPGGVQIEAPGGTVIVITPAWWEYYQLWYMNIDGRHVRTTQGLLGTIAPKNWLPALPDGTLMGPRPEDLHQRHQALYGKFGKAWRVTDATTLFDYSPGTSTKTFTAEDWPCEEPSGGCKIPTLPGGPVAKPPLEPMALDVAINLSKEIVDPDRRANCIKDLVATGERGFAKTYLLADKIARNPAPTSPILVSPAENSIGLVSPVTFTWNKSTDAEGEPISYRLHVWPVNEMPNTNDATPVSTKEAATQPKTVAKAISELESGKAYFWNVIAEDGNGASIESDTRRLQLK